MNRILRRALIAASNVPWVNRILCTHLGGQVWRADKTVRCMECGKIWKY
jgi:hypothetical protein